VKIEGFLLFVIYLLLLFTMFGVLRLNDILYQWHKEWQIVSAQPVDTRPVIPQCDKQLWERITDGCDDEGHD
jgi:hypothetical protein